MAAPALQMLLRHSARPLSTVYGVQRRGLADLAFTMASPLEVFFNKAKVRQVDVPTTNGDFGILPEHVPTIAALRPGVVVVHGAPGSEVPKKYFVSSGTISVNADSSVQLLAEEAFTLDSFDSKAVKDGLIKANKDLGSAQSEKQRVEARIAVEAYEALDKAVSGH